MNLKVEKLTRELLVEYGEVSIAFYVEKEYQVTPIANGLEGLQLLEVEPELPYWVDQGIGESPEDWWDRWDLSNWGMISAFEDGRRVGGAIIAFDTEGIDMLAGRKDIAVLWDLRVDEEWRGRGIGSNILLAAIEWARRHQCNHLKIETQTYNVAACKFYAKHGAVLGSIDTHAYPHQSRIKQLIWYVDL